MASCIISYCFPSDGKENGLEPFVYGKNQYLQKLTQVSIYLHNKDYVTLKGTYFTNIGYPKTVEYN